MSKIKLLTTAMIIASIICGCSHFEVSKKTLIDYRHDAAHQEISTTGFGDDKEVNSYYYPEQWSLLYEITMRMVTPKEDGRIARGLNIKRLWRSLENEKKPINHYSVL